MQVVLNTPVEAKIRMDTTFGKRGGSVARTDSEDCDVSYKPSALGTIIHQNVAVTCNDVGVKRM